MGAPKADKSTDKLRECDRDKRVKKSEFFADVIQGDTSGSGCSLVSADMKTKVAYKEHIIKPNFCFNVNKISGLLE